MRRMLVVLLAGCGSVEPAGSVADAGGGGAADSRVADAASGPDAAVVTMNTPGKHVHTLTVGGLEREVIVYVPAQARTTRPPVVFMFHGTSGDGERFFNVSGWREKADAEGLIAVFPSALTHCFFEDENQDGDFNDAGELKITTKWSAGKLGETYVLCTAEQIAQLPADKQALVDHPLADDVAFFRAMLDLAGTGYAIDRTRVYVTGFSNGGEMTSRLAVEVSDRIAAGAAAAGPLSEEIVAPRPVPFVFSVGSLDDRFTVKLGVPELPLGESLFTDLPPLAGLNRRYLKAFSLAESTAYAPLTLGGKAVNRFISSTSLVGASNQFQFAVIEDATHQYPNGANHPVSMADVLWTFFKPYALPN